MELPTPIPQHKELRAASNHVSSQGAPSPAEPPDETPDSANTLVAALNPKQRTSCWTGLPGCPTHGAHDVINMRCSEPLIMWWCLGGTAAK